MGLPRPLSHSSISLYTECPQKYEFKYIEKIPEKPRHFFSFGSSVHSALEFFYGVKTPPAPSLEAVLKNYKKIWISAGYKDAIQEAEYFEEGRGILERFYQKHIADFQIPYFVEYQFNLKVDGVPITGRVDRIDKTPAGKLWVTDYKTGKALALERVLTDEQLTLYQMACEELLGAEVERLSFYHLPSLQEQTVQRHSEGAVQDLKRKITDTAESISRGLFDPKPAEQKCRWCDYKPLCPIFKNGQTSWNPKSSASAEAASKKETQGFSEVAGERDVAALVDRYGELISQARLLNEETQELKNQILSIFKEKKFVRAFGKKFEVNVLESERWEFSDRKKVLAAIKRAGLYDQTLAPAAPKVEALLNDGNISPALQSEIAALGKKTRVQELELGLIKK